MQISPEQDVVQNVRYNLFRTFIDILELNKFETQSQLQRNLEKKIQLFPSDHPGAEPPGTANTSREIYTSFYSSYI